MAPKPLVLQGFIGVVSQMSEFLSGSDYSFKMRI
jgi:hypothetical protein